MAVAVPLETLRDRIAEAIAGGVKAYNVPVACVRLGIQDSVKESDGTEAFGSKRMYVKNRLLSLSRADLLRIAEAVLLEYASGDLSDTVSEMTRHSEHRVSELVRRDVLKAINPLSHLFGELQLLDSLSEIFGVSIIRDDPGGILGRDSLERQVVQHCIRNNDWPHDELLARCGALTCSQARFFALLEKLLHPMTRRDAEQHELAERVNHSLKRDGFAVRQIGAESGYAVYGVVRSQPGVAGEMKNLIFASIGEKPQLVFRDAVNNDVEIVKNADKVLVFDRPLPSSGMLVWQDLQDWWAQARGVSDANAAKSQLYRRLLQSVRSAQSAGEYALFYCYYERYGALLGPKMPLLIPQVYLHYDPYTRRERGDEQVLARQRMDFLLMLDQGARIVLEVDGRHHYAVQDSTDQDVYIANAKRYAEMAMEDRRLKLAGYEVYRFGGQEFMDVDPVSWTVGPNAQQVAAAFFDRLLKKHGVL